MKKKLVILAGGFGSRLKSVVSDVPKALAPIGDRPFLYLQLENWISLGITSFVFSLHHQYDQIVDFLESEKEGLLKKVDIRWVVEPKPLNTGGAIAYVLKEMKLRGDFYLSNADTWLGDGFTLLQDKKSPTMGIVYCKDANRYGKVIIDETDKITSFVEKASGDEEGYINAGVSLLNSELFSGWDGLPFSLETSLYPELVKRGILKGVKLNTEFIDIGIPKDYYRFCELSKLKNAKNG